MQDEVIIQMNLQFACVQTANSWYCFLYWLLPKHFLRTIADWNKLPEEIVNICKIEAFKEAITTHLKQVTTG